MQDDEWISTVDASSLLGVSYEMTRNVLRLLDCATRKYQSGNLWRRVDVLAAKDLIPSLGSALAERRKGYEQRESTKPNLRPCMCCERPFPSEGIHNRLCANCRHGDGLEFSLPRGRK